MTVPAADAAATGSRFGGKLARYASSGVFLRLFRLGYAYAKPKLLAPSQFGLWNALSLVATYAELLHLGSQTAMGYRVPRLLTEGRVAEANRHKATVLLFTLTYRLVLAAGLLVAAAMVADRTVAFGLVAVAVQVVLLWHYNGQLTVLKTEQRFDVISAANLVQGVAVAAIGIPAIMTFGVYGVFGGAVLSTAVTCAFLEWRHRLRPGKGFDGRLLVALIGEGLPIMALAHGLDVVTAVDRLVVVAALGTDSLGHYMVAVVAAELILQIPVAARDIREPEMMADIGTDHGRPLWDTFLLSPLLNTAAWFPLLAGGVALMGEDMLRLVLPAYVSSYPPAAILAFGCHFMALAHVTRGIYARFGWQKTALPVLGASILLNGAVCWLAVVAGWGNPGVAGAAALNFAVVYFGLLAQLLLRSPYKRGEAISLMAATVLPAVVAMAFVLVVRHLLPPPSVGVWRHLGWSITAFAAYCGLVVATGSALRRRYPAVTMPRLRRRKLRP